MRSFGADERVRLVRPTHCRQVRDVRPRTRLVVTGTICDTEEVRIGEAPRIALRLTTAPGELDLLFLGRRTVAGNCRRRVLQRRGTAQLKSGAVGRLEPALQAGIERSSR